ncbi:UDP-N-acetylmuramoyl-L-alanyl-D-glutamate--2,6-diaminopimelate ligase [Cohnella sp. CFH 77786]|uniref:UDP-N-acetylmuramoyl-L-alanyl-D-glutamate--2, 6-diaminopimelate ligase n=1 Tax=Cohnella sp. CFH 77786 TaxID=2662265 RepID=UPI001C60F6A9|nr:UDP-N-acetylmuramoyl-L-alanyl-D-glutamate--2,6-diaminopimelate ligase [Cohnella sp. CFH 77786]MBW5444833.1 UDP-N-acetylmuramoyl-L-alanyl-D-glutamate--2,6-diaminopimelate ligase [Cohnella sp. CFH 77786]
MNLLELSRQLLISRIVGDGNAEIQDLETDSRKAKPGDLFFCLPGHTVDGHQFAGEAAGKGAAALVVSRELPVPLPQLVVPDPWLALALLADFFHGRPSRTLRPIGVTGTNGKTTTTYLIEKILSDSGVSAGVIGTIEARYGGVRHPMSRTTPGVLELQRIFRSMVDAGTDRCVMEVSSHSLEQGRVKGVRFRTAVFTNLTQDHLDYHGTMEAYEAAKGLFFSRLGNEYAANPEDRVYAALNADDPASARFAKLTAAEVITYGIDREADLRAKDVAVTARGTSFTLSTIHGERQVRLRMVGKFNVYNALAALAAAACERIPLDAAVASLESVSGVPGRVEAVDEGQPFAVVVDYAHTPDGLDNVLRTVRELAAGRVICVFGCGGDRDRTKRPLMGKIAAALADSVIVTSDNPRTEDPMAILKDIETGLLEANVDPDRYVLLPDRREAIEKAVEMASPGDVVLIAGKGHETYQIIGGVTYDFDDRLAARDAIRSITK